jgi:hypothetical protein
MSGFTVAAVMARTSAGRRPGTGLGSNLGPLRPLPAPWGLRRPGDGFILAISTGVCHSGEQGRRTSWRGPTDGPNGADRALPAGDP